MSDEGSPEPRLYPAPLVGYRAWKMSPLGHLGSTGQTHRWRPGVNRAACKAGGEHAAPDANCPCGLYATHRLDQLGLGTGLVVSGAIAGRGQVRIHDAGFRAAEAQIIGLWAARHHPLRRLIARIAARRYRVPLFSDPCELGRWAERVGGGARPEEAPGSSDPDYLVNVSGVGIPGLIWALGMAGLFSIFLVVAPVLWLWEEMRFRVLKLPRRTVTDERLDTGAFELR